MEAVARETIGVGDAQELMVSALISSDVSVENAAEVSRALVAAECAGQYGHGFVRLGVYCAQAMAGKVRGFARPRLEALRSGFLSIDADFGFAYPALRMAREALVTSCRKEGIALATIYNSHHGGMLGYQVESLAHEGLIAMTFANTYGAVAPWGGIKPVFGTNPIAFAAPRKNAFPVVVDLSLSVIARGKVISAAKLGQSLEPGWAFDSQGAPTIDPEAALAGTIAPIGGAKGAALALMVEILCGALAGPHFSYESTSMTDDKGGPPGLGQVMIAIDPGARDRDHFAARLEDLLGEIADQSRCRIPGMRREALRAQHEREGLSVPVALLDEARALAGAPRIPA